MRTVNNKSEKILKEAETIEEKPIIEDLQNIEDNYEQIQLPLKKAKRK